MQRSLDGIRHASGGRIPKWSPALPRAVNFRPGKRPAAHGAERIVYFPSCAARNMGAQRGDDTEPLPVAAERLFHKAGFDVIYPKALAELCCGQPFESKGLAAAADMKSAELEYALREASDNGRWPIVFDTSPCAYRMQRYCHGRLAVQDSIEFIHDTVLPRVAIASGREPVVVHPVCSVRKMGTVDKLTAIAGRCSPQVIAVDDVLCCGFAGEKGFNRPELNEFALRRLKEPFRPAARMAIRRVRTCEIGLSGAGGLSLSLRSSTWSTRAQQSRRSAARGRTRRPVSAVALRKASCESCVVHSLLRGRVFFPRWGSRHSSCSSALGWRWSIPESDVLRTADGKTPDATTMRLPPKRFSSRISRGMTISSRPPQLHAPRAREPHRNSPNRGYGRGPAADLRVGGVRA
jgi:hypothetical protein